MPQKVYGFFDCKEPQEKIQDELNFISDDFQVPQSAGWSLNKVSELRPSPTLLNFLRQTTVSPQHSAESDRRLKPAKLIELEYVLEFPNLINDEKYTKDLVGDILLQLYQSDLYIRGDPYIGAVVSENDGKFALKN
ncbi:MAG: hypothetical protein KAT77_00125 [Nanoarchaeota archaeon]|nr:hypothetical protein [Nanoarchaeota archaeon]